MPTRRLPTFEGDIQRARELVGLGTALAGLTVGRVDATDMYRAALVQAVAALDSYVHGVVLDYGVDILCGRRAPGSKTKVGLDFAAVCDLLGAPTPGAMEVRAISHTEERLAKETFQRPDDIAQAFSMVGVPKVWSTAFPGGSNQHTTALGLVVTRRNQIVHRCDADPANTGSVSPISEGDALGAADTIDTIVKAVEACM